MRRFILLLAAAALPMAAFAQTGTFTIIAGPGAGNNVTAIAGAVNNPGPGNFGTMTPPHAGAPGPNWHYHGQLTFLPDPNPGTFGWGFLNFPAPPPGPATGLTPTTASGTLLLTYGSPASSGLAADPAFDAPLPGEAGPLEQLLANGQPPGPERDRAVWESFSAALRKPDAANAAKHTPQPLARMRVIELWNNMQLIGAKAKVL